MEHFLIHSESDWSSHLGIKTFFVATKSSLVVEEIIMINVIKGFECALLKFCTITIFGIFKLWQ